MIPLDLRSTTEEDGVGDACTDAAATGNEDWENGNAAEGDGSFATPATVADRGVAANGMSNSVEYIQQAVQLDAPTQRTYLGHDVQHVAHSQLQRLQESQPFHGEG